MKVDEQQKKWFVLHPELLQPFDIIMEKEHTDFWEAYYKKTGIGYSHAKLYISDGSYIDVSGTVVKAQQVLRTLYIQDDDVMILRINVPLSNVQKIQIEQFARSEIGKEFQIPKRVNPYKKGEDVNEQNREYCVRLVANAYAAAGIELVNNAMYCTPNDIINSSSLHEVNIKLTSASQEEICYAQSKCVINDQDVYTGDLFGAIRNHTNADIQNETQLTDFLIKNPSYDESIYQTIKGHPYFTMLDKYHKDHPEEYDAHAFVKKYKKDALVAAEAMAYKARKMQVCPYGVNLSHYKGLYAKYNFKTAALFLNLYERLIDDCEKRKALCLQVQQLI